MTEPCLCGDPACPRCFPHDPSVERVIYREEILPGYGYVVRIDGRFAGSGHGYPTIGEAQDAAERIPY